MTDKASVEKFLSELKKIISHSGIYVFGRDKTIEGLINLGITKKIAQQEIETLTYSDYSSGPEQDRDASRSGKVWVFGKKINQAQAYIKIKIEEKDGEKIARCISFHPAEYKMEFPIRERSKRREKNGGGKEGSLS